MKLSEAIRKGATLRPQYTDGGMFWDGCSCALAGAYEAMYGDIEQSKPSDRVIFTNLYRVFPELQEDIGRTTLGNQIIYRNDILLMTREEIADWVESEGY